MPSAVATSRTVGSPPHNDQPNYDQEVDDFMRDLDFNNEASNTTHHPQEPAKDIDEEVQVKKKRKPNPKLDEARLLSQNGIPKLRRLTKSKLKFRGKGHEYGDITALLNMYQLWLDDLYPKAKFKDGLTMVEKVGHSKRMQITRKAWLDATKPHRREDSQERLGDVQMSGGLGNQEGGAEGGQDSDGDDIFGLHSDQAGAIRDNAAVNGEDAPADDELDALLNERAEGVPSTEPTKQDPARGPFEEDSEMEEDELDALLNQPGNASAQDIPIPQVCPNGRVNGGDGGHDDFADDEEAMASMGW